ncbi:hypothetical protein GCM10010302_75040 [Streptomyces polychromogenes]|uniref:Uncharacterized protein n=1 Tax=Streptomyces polychromogenes TaxID=67342 RepID=A0ABP3FTZ3_9ACTN
MPSPTAQELLASIHGLSPEDARQIADHIDECRDLLAAGTDMDTLQQHLKDQGVTVIRAIVITTRLIGDHPSRLRAAREIVEMQPRTHARYRAQQPTAAHHAVERTELHGQGFRAKPMQSHASLTNQLLAAAPAPSQLRR